jgi:hypothetical protein
MTGVVWVMVVLDRIRHGFHPPHHDEGTTGHIAILRMFDQSSAS